MHPAHGDWDDYGEWLEAQAREADDEALAERLAELEASRMTPPEPYDDNGIPF